MSFTPVFVVSDQSSTTVSVDISSQLVSGETLVSATLQSVTPATVPVLLASVGAVSAQAFALSLVNGLDGTTYGLKFDLVTTLKSFVVTAAVQVLTNVNVPYFSQNPNAYADLLGELFPGEAAIGKSVFVLPAGSSTSGGYVDWEILDAHGFVASAGNCISFDVTVESFATVVRTEAVVSLPSSVAPTLSTQGYQLRWALHRPSETTLYAYESLRVPERETVPIGAGDLVELEGADTTVGLVISRPYTNVTYQIYLGNSILNPTQTPVGSPVKVSSGWYYSIVLPSASLPASLDPYQVVWRYWNSSTPNQVSVEQGRIYLLNGSILSAVDHCRNLVSKAKTTLLGFDDAIFDTATIVTWLSRGRDYFNVNGGVLTYFTMMNASGAIRELWLRCAEISMLRAQSLAEGEKAFDFQGQAISLSVDKTQYYDKLADSLESSLQNDLPPLKRAMRISGVNGGSGNMTEVANGGYKAKLGISVTPASTYLRPFRWR